MEKIYKLSKMMQHYVSIKEKHSDCFIFYRLGDFYELFFEDAITVSKLLDITLTGRDCGLQNKAPMCGVPYHAVESYIAKLINAGYKVAICEQLTEPGKQKGLVERDVIRVITPGTTTSEDTLEAKSNNYLLSVFEDCNGIGLAWSDISTGSVKTIEFSSKEEVKFADFIASMLPAEMIGNDIAVEHLNRMELVMNKKLRKAETHYSYSFDFDNAKSRITDFYKIYNLDSLEIKNSKKVICALGGLISYIELTQKGSLAHISIPKLIRNTDKMFLDYSTIKNLELLETISTGKRHGSLISVLDKTSTSMGARELRNLITEPFINKKTIELRLEAVDSLYKNTKMRKELISMLSNIKDIERLCNKISYNSINPRECLSIANSLKQIGPIKRLLELNKSTEIQNISNNLHELEDLIKSITDAIDDNPSVSITEGGFIKKGFLPELDDYRNAQKKAKQWLAEYEYQEREQTGIKTLKVGYNRVFGYYIEVSNSYLGKVPDRFIRKQTLSTGERYITDELKQMEIKILNSQNLAVELELKIYKDIKNQLLSNLKTIQTNAQLIASVDVYVSMATVALENHYVKPLIKENSKKLVIKGGRHPVIESLKGINEFVPNDTIMDDTSMTLVITGPNMGGKSTYMRQVAVIVLMAQIGSFVPANSVEIGIVDRIFTRVGASDNLSFGQSTFMVEMAEVANIINNATDKSLIVFDEVGRGTSTLDGLSIAWAIVEYVSLKTRAKTLFATHYHELSQLESMLPSLKNYHVLIKDYDGEIAFLYKIARGAASKSFGLEVAALAGINSQIITRAKIIMRGLENSRDSEHVKLIATETPTESSTPTTQIGFFASDERVNEITKILNDIDVNNCTPIQSMTILLNLKELAKNMFKNNK